MNVHYDDGGARLHTYECVERWTHYGEPKCQHLAGPCLDAFVSQQVLLALQPAALELSLTATERVEQERAELDRLWQQRRERAAYEVERAARQYQTVEPEHRLVARTLERARARETGGEASTRRGVSSLCPTEATPPFRGRARGDSPIGQ